jgi:hypothetical protein
LLDQLDPPVLGPPLFVVVGGDGGEHRAAEGPQAGGGDPVILDERLEDGLGPVLGQLEVAFHAADVVGVAHDVELEGRVGRQHLGDFADGLGRFGFDRGQAGIEINSLNRHVSGRFEAVGEERGVGDDVLDHFLFLDDDQGIFAGEFRGYLGPDLLAVLSQLESGTTLFAEDDRPSLLLDGVLEVALDLQHAGLRARRILRVIVDLPHLALNVFRLFLGDFKLKSVELAVFAGMDPRRRHPGEGRVVLAILVVLLLGGGADGQKANQGENQSDRTFFHRFSPLFRNALRLFVSPGSPSRNRIKYQSAAGQANRQHKDRTERCQGIDPF